MRKPKPRKKPLYTPDTFSTSEAAKILKITTNQLQLWFKYRLLDCGKTSPLGYGRRLTVADLESIRVSKIFRAELARREYRRLLKEASLEARIRESVAKGE